MEKQKATKATTTTTNIKQNSSSSITTPTIASTIIAGSSSPSSSSQFRSQHVDNNPTTTTTTTTTTKPTKQSKFFAQNRPSSSSSSSVSYSSIKASSLPTTTNSTPTTPKTSNFSAIKFSSSSSSPSSSSTRVVKLRRKNGEIAQDCDVYIGRAMNMGGWNLPHSKWGNPYPVATCGGSATVACQKYRDYVLRRDDLLDALMELDGKVLGCWCKVDPTCDCHGDVLVELLEMKKRNELDNYVKNYLAQFPNELYPVPVKGTRKN